MTVSDAPTRSTSRAKYAWQLLRAGPLRLDGGSMFGVVPRALWSRDVSYDEQGRIELAHNCLLLEPSKADIPAGSASRTDSSPLGAMGKRTRLPVEHASNAGTHGQVGTLAHGTQEFPSSSRTDASGSSQVVRGADPAKPAAHGRIIIEVGSGNKFDEKSRKIFGLTDRWIATALAEAGCRCEDIPHAIVTHLHFDHAGGLTCRDDIGKLIPTFPNATVHVQRREWDDALANNSVMTRTYLPENLEPIRDQLCLIESPLPFPLGSHPRRDELPKTSPDSRMVEILPGIRVLSVPGHTWGQQAVLFTDDQDRTIVFPADLLPTAHHVGAAYNMAYDVEPYISTVTRRWFLEAAAANNWLLVLDHEPENPCQRVKADGKGWFRFEAQHGFSEEL